MEIFSTRSVAHLGSNLEGVREPLSDLSLTGKGRPWRVQKLGSQYYGEACQALGQDKRAERVLNCGSYLVFLVCIENKEHPKKLASARFCKDRLCSMCQWRRSLRQFKTSVQLGHELLRRQPTYKFLFLTLTVPNVKLEELSGALDHIFESWRRLYQRQEVRKVVKAYLRTLEVTYNHLEDTWHPHLHALLAVPSSYFTGNRYIKHEQWLDLWRESTRMPEITQVDIRVVKPKVTDSKQGEKKVVDPLVVAFAECSKYGVKPWSTKSGKSNKKLIKVLESGGEPKRDMFKGHIFIRKTLEETAQVVEQLQNALRNRRLVQVGGMFRDIKKELELKDGEDKDADLVNTSDQETGCECDLCSSEMTEVWYYWESQLADYYSIELESIT